MKVKLGDVCTITSSKRCHLSERDESGVPFYRSKEILQLDSGDEINDCDYISYDLYSEIQNKFGVPVAGDLLITSRGTIGTPYLYKEGDCFYFADGNLSWLKSFSKDINSAWLYFWLKSDIGSNAVLNCSKGTAQKAVSLELLREIRISLPPIEDQSRIVSILSAYDSLIENNRKQIKLLEEAAQRLYKEWFIDLRFPGRESTPINPETGLPEGWCRLPIARVFPNITIGKTPSRKRTDCFSNTGIAWYSVSDLGAEGTYTMESSERLTPDAIKEFNVKVVPENTILLSFKLTIGRVSITTDLAATNEAIAHFVSDDNSLINYSYWYLHEFPYETLGSTSSISKAINSKMVKAIPFVLPTREVIADYDTAVKPIMQEILNLRRTSMCALEARNRLLPKLISCESEVF